MEKIQATLDTLVTSNANLTSKMDKLDALSRKMDKLNTSVNSIGARLDSTEANLLLQTNKVAAQELGPLVEKSRPRTVIFKLHHLQKKISIMEAVKSTLFELKALPGVKLRICRCVGGNFGTNTGRCASSSMAKM
ncbi:unnamed protein product [Arctogadus glacialis]